MGADSKNDMERIQRNLEQFLMEDLSADPAYGNREQKRNRSAGSRSIDPIWPQRQTGRRMEPDEWDEEEWDEEDEWEENERVNVRRTNPGRANTRKSGAGKSLAVRADTKTANTRKGNSQKGNTGKAGKANNRKTNTKKTDRKKGKGKKLLLIVGILAVICVIGWYALVSAIYGKMTYNRPEGLTGTPLKSEGVYNILLIGNDSRSQGDDGRSDAMILLSITKKTKSIQMISLLRDMYVDIPGHDGNRLNAAYAYGGPELLIETIKQNLGIEVNRYVVVNFQAFANLVDAVGGVDLELTNEEVQWVNAYLNEYNMLRDMPIDTDYLDTSLSGMIHLNGPQALAYTRNRYIGTDFGRTERQRKVLSAVIKKLPLTAFTNMGELIDGLFPNLTTNLTKEECMLLSLQAGKLVTYELVQSSVPVEGSYSNATIRGMAVLQVDFEANKKFLRESIYGE